MRRDASLTREGLRLRAGGLRASAGGTRYWVDIRFRPATGDGTDRPNVATRRPLRADQLMTARRGAVSPTGHCFDQGRQGVSVGRSCGVPVVASGAIQSPRRRIVNENLVLPRTNRGVEGRWSGRLDLNQRPPDPQSGALPGCATPRPCEFYHTSGGRRMRGVSLTGTRRRSQHAVDTARSSEEDRMHTDRAKPYTR
jgi:hypothetical protein